MSFNSSILVGLSPFHLAARDFNQDGRPDLIVTDAKNVYLLLNTASGFAPAVPILMSSPGALVVVSDCNGDALTQSLPNPFSGPTLTASVTAIQAFQLPTGTVSFCDGSTLLGVAALVNGAARFTPSNSAGPHSYRAVYSGDAFDAPSYP